MNHELYKDNEGKWRWRIVHKNGRIIGASSQGYVRRDGAKNNFETIINYGSATKTKRFI